ncbi:uncharacterized protein LOC120348896 [Nilaparvata lugens]|uniref:uncharacterized protein LOC120348896 n=1 Tax=Nilaparvata lugens TaxID=108931 RepID=UPI00193CFED2|nr:uncharacterized protein LOC120348896 [Nilaparvata lugens]
MKVSLHFQVLAALYICNFVCGSEESEIAPSIDYPYIVHNMIKLADRWENVVIRLSFLQDPEINKLLDEYKNVVHSNNQDVEVFLHKMVIQHCILRNFMRNLDLKLEDENDNRVARLRTAIKLKLEVSNSRISNEQVDLQMMEENKFKLMKIDLALSLKKLSEDDESNALPVMREKMKYVVHTTAMEYIYLSMVDSRISTFLIKLFNLMDVNQKTADGFVYYDVILLFDPTSNFRTDSYDEKRDGNNFIRKFFKEVTSVKDYLEKHVRNKQQMYFQNQMMMNHFHLMEEILNLQNDEIDVLNRALGLKLEYFQQKLNCLTTNISQYKDNTGDSSLSLDRPISLVDMLNDSTFTELKGSSMNSGKRERLEKALTMWTEEKLAMSIIADDDMFLALNEIFLYIVKDRNRIIDSMPKEKTSFEDIMHIKNEFIPVFQP